MPTPPSRPDAPALLGAALAAGSPELFASALHDRLHEPYSPGGRASARSRPGATPRGGPRSDAVGVGPEHRRLGAPPGSPGVRGRARGALPERGSTEARRRAGGRRLRALRDLSVQRARRVCTVRARAELSRWSGFPPAAPPLFRPTETLESPGRSAGSVGDSQARDGSASFSTVSLAACGALWNAPRNFPQSADVLLDTVWTDPHSAHRSW